MNINKLKKLVTDPSEYYHNGDAGFEFSVGSIRCKLLTHDSVSVAHLDAAKGMFVLVFCGLHVEWDVPVRIVKPSKLAAVLAELEQSAGVGEFVTVTNVGTALNHLRDELTSQEAVLMAQYTRSVQALQVEYANKATKLQAMLDKKIPKGKYVLQFDGYPESKEYSSLKEVRRAHSKRNIPHVDCSIIEYTETTPIKVAVWDTEQRFWQYQSSWLDAQAKSYTPKQKIWRPSVTKNRQSDS